MPDFEDPKDTSGWTALHHAMEAITSLNGSKPMCESFVRHLALAVCDNIDTSLLFLTTLLHQRPAGKTGFHMLVKANDNEILREKLMTVLLNRLDEDQQRRLVNMKTTDRGQNTALHLAAAGGAVWAVKALLETQRCNVEILNGKRMTALDSANGAFNKAIRTALQQAQVKQNPDADMIPVRAENARSRPYGQLSSGKRAERKNSLRAMGSGYAVGPGQQGKPWDADGSDWRDWADSQPTPYSADSQEGTNVSDRRTRRSDSSAVSQYRQQPAHDRQSRPSSSADGQHGQRPRPSCSDKYASAGTDSRNAAREFGLRRHRERMQGRQPNPKNSYSHSSSR